ncbi:MAG: Hsp20/alpha crystallin family protein [Smithellaceae bacterium]|nr:Hsp20/alpha crystallin family protein [Smithellaceae bacterium]
MAEEKDLRPEANSGLTTERTRAKKVYLPKVDIYETADTIVMAADMPGVDEKSVNVMLEKNVLTIGGAVTPAEFEGYSMAYAEYDTGDFERAFTISDEVDKDGIEAVVKNGVLKVILPKASNLKARKIAIKTE